MKLWIFLMALLVALPPLAGAYSLTTEPKPDELDRLPLFTQAYAYTNVTHHNRMIRFRLYVRNTGPLTNLRSTELALAHPRQGMMFEGRVESDSGGRQGIPAIDFTVDEVCLPTSFVVFTLPHYQGGQQQYRVNLQMLYDRNRAQDIDGYVASRKPSDETNDAFKAFMQREYAPWRIPVMKE